MFAYPEIKGQKYCVCIIEKIKNLNDTPIK